MSDLEITLPLLGHGGALDTLNHHTTTAGARLSTLMRHSDPDVVEAATAVMEQLGGIDAVSRLTQCLALGGQLKIHQPRPEDIQWWEHYKIELPSDQMKVIERYYRVRPS